MSASSRLFHDFTGNHPCYHSSSLSMVGFSHIFTRLGIDNFTELLRALLRLWALYRYSVCSIWRSLWGSIRSMNWETLILDTMLMNKVQILCHVTIVFFLYSFCAMFNFMCSTGNRRLYEMVYRAHVVFLPFEVHISSYFNTFLLLRRIVSYVKNDYYQWYSATQ